MRVEQYSLTANEIKQGVKASGPHPDLVLVFASSALMRSDELFPALQQAYPESPLAGCSTAGEINLDSVVDDSAVISEVFLQDASCNVVTSPVSGIKDSKAAGIRLAEQVEAKGLKAVVLFAPGVDVNGSAIINGIASVLGGQIPISGGLAGDGSDFEQTSTISSAGIETDQLCAVCFYGDSLNFEYGSFGGWNCFGPMRKVTRCDGNILYELDGKPALELYKQYLGEYASELPSSALLFPLEMMTAEKRESGIIRTILGVNEENGSLILAGDIDPDGYLRLMHTSVDGLINGAETAASDISVSEQDRLAILVSCVGRKLVMGDEVAEEVEAVNMKLGKRTVSTGFYSYGEICPAKGLTQCDLHNQTMTLTVISEN
ncbi:FIST N-terminal domain-containing protein [Neptuniibacter sp.]|uniref:FIST signal transduction protein n=1 Tax=Neptuniibacter sp. TaxID=1962643 RepID=UPI0026205E68|nr:FIST N-terminal domain-containing protein [Neptuniibacter sp.]MCP4597313.1 hypothetical protein [Neptuniibacter sp.]